MDAEHRHRFKVLIKRIRKGAIKKTIQEVDENGQPVERVVEEGGTVMWGLFAMEEIPAGSFIMEYVGEIVPKLEGDMRGSYCDQEGLSYLFDMNDVKKAEEPREVEIQKSYEG